MVEPLKPGIYVYEVKSRSPQAAESTQIREREVLTATEDEPGFLRQRSYTRVNGKATYFSEAVYTNGAVYDISEWLGDGVCFFGPPIATPYPMGVGASWEAKSYCANDPVPRRQVNGRWNVTTIEEITVRSGTYKSFVIEFYTELRQADGGGWFNEGKIWYSDDSRLSIKSKYKTALLKGGSARELNSELVTHP